MGDDVFVVEDTHENDLFKNNILVLNEPNIRFYAGAPLKTKDGFKLGSLCIIDNKPKKITEEQKKILIILADKVISEISNRELLKEYYIEVENVKKLKNIADMEISKLNSLIGSTDNIIFLIDKERKLSAFNKSFEISFEKTFKKIPYVGMPNSEYFDGNSSLFNENIKRAFLGDKFTTEIETKIENNSIYLEVTFNSVFF